MDYQPSYGFLKDCLYRSESYKVTLADAYEPSSRVPPYLGPAGVHPSRLWLCQPARSACVGYSVRYGRYAKQLVISPMGKPHLASHQSTPYFAQRAGRACQLPCDNC